MKLTPQELAMPSAHTGGTLFRRSSKREITAYLRYLVYDDAWLVSDVFTLLTFRGRGIASSLLEEVLAMAASETDYPRVVAMVAGNEMPQTLDNDQLLAWYQGHGMGPHPQFDRPERRVVVSHNSGCPRWCDFTEGHMRAMELDANRQLRHDEDGD